MAGSHPAQTGVHQVSMRSFQVVVERDSEDRAWVTYVPALDFISTFGETREEALANIREAIVGYLEAAKKEGLPVFPNNMEAELVSVEIAVP